MGRKRNELFDLTVNKLVNKNINFIEAVKNLQHKIRNDYTFNVDAVDEKTSTHKAAYDILSNDIEIFLRNRENQ